MTTCGADMNRLIGNLESRWDSFPRRIGDRWCRVRSTTGSSLKSRRDGRPVLLSTYHASLWGIVAQGIRVVSVCQTEYQVMPVLDSV